MGLLLLVVAVGCSDLLHGGGGLGQSQQEEVVWSNPGESAFCCGMLAEKGLRTPAGDSEVPTAVAVLPTRQA